MKIKKSKQTLKKPRKQKELFYKLSNGQKKSFIHDINPELKEVNIILNGLPKLNVSVLNMVIEIPKNTNKKMEISVDKLFNPIIQDTKNGKLRTVPAEKITNLRKYKEPLPTLHTNTNIQYYMRDIWPVGSKGYSQFSYGAIPKTFEDASHKESLRDYYTKFPSSKKYAGDGDPLDIFLINDFKKRESGEIVRVVVIGIFPMIDDNEIDWKLIAVPYLKKKSLRSSSLSTIRINLSEDEIELYRLWFQHYKDKVINGNLKSGGVKIGTNLGPKVATKVIKHCLKEYQNIIQGQHNNHLKNLKLYSSFQLLKQLK